jgi:hypothetical protein
MEPFLAMPINLRLGWIMADKRTSLQYLSSTRCHKRFYSSGPMFVYFLSFMAVLKSLSHAVDLFIYFVKMDRLSQQWKLHYLVTPDRQRFHRQGHIDRHGKLTDCRSVFRVSTDRQ